MAKKLTPEQQAKLEAWEAKSRAKLAASEAANAEKTAAAKAAEKANQERKEALKQRDAAIGRAVLAEAHFDFFGDWDGEVPSAPRITDEELSKPRVIPESYGDATEHLD